MNKGHKGIRVVIADDHLIVREGLRLILETDPEMELVGDAPDGASLIGCDPHRRPWRNAAATGGVVALARSDVLGKTDSCSSSGKCR